MSWEGFVVQSIIHSADQWTPRFYRTSNGTEIDLILEKNQEKITPSFFNTLDEIKITESYCYRTRQNSLSINANIQSLFVI